MGNPPHISITIWRYTFGFGWLWVRFNRDDDYPDLEINRRGILYALPWIGAGVWGWTANGTLGRIHDTWKELKEEREAWKAKQAALKLQREAQADQEAA